MSQTAQMLEAYLDQPIIYDLIQRIQAITPSSSPSNTDTDENQN